MSDEHVLAILEAPYCHRAPADRRNRARWGGAADRLAGVVPRQDIDGAAGCGERHTDRSAALVEPTRVGARVWTLSTVDDPSPIEVAA